MLYLGEPCRRLLNFALWQNRTNATIESNVSTKMLLQRRRRRDHDHDHDGDDDEHGADNRPQQQPLLNVLVATNYYDDEAVAAAVTAHPPLLLRLLPLLLLMLSRVTLFRFLDLSLGSGSWPETWRGSRKKNPPIWAPMLRRRA